MLQNNCPWEICIGTNENEPVVWNHDPEEAVQHYKEGTQGTDVVTQNI